MTTSSEAVSGTFAPDQFAAVAHAVEPVAVHERVVPPQAAKVPVAYK
jgi:hypothetical protein